MSIELLQAVKGHIDDAGLMSGYATKYFRWTDADEEGEDPFILFRIGGNGDSNVVVQQTDVDILLLQTPTSAVDGDNRMADILRLFRTTSRRAGILRFLPIGTKLGPFYLENGRPFWQLTIRVFTEDQ